MRVLLDAHLPPALVRVFAVAGHEAQTTLELSHGNGSSDAEIREAAEDAGMVVVTKDKDFYYSHVLQRRPAKLVMVRCGNLRLRDLVALFERKLPDIENAMEHGDLFEIHDD